MLIKQFEDKHLSHYSYSILSEAEKKIILVDPARNPQPYLDYANRHDSKIVGVIETHPHADFVSGHLELHKLTGAVIYSSKISGASYSRKTFDDGQVIEIGELKLFAINTPGHSPDSISILAEEDGKQIAVFTGDTLFVGDCGRPDLRENERDLTSKKEALAKDMYYSLRNKLMMLPGEVKVYPAHGEGSLCGKSLSGEKDSTIDRESQSNWSLQEMSENEFVNLLLENQPFIPSYFPFNVELNLAGAGSLKDNISRIKTRLVENAEGSIHRNSEDWIVDTRDEAEYKNGHLQNSMNLMETGKFETWLGTLVKPGEKFYIASKDEEQLQRMLKRAGSIGYETFVKEGLIIEKGEIREEKLDLGYFKKNRGEFTILDVRNRSEVKDDRIFENSISIPLPELKENFSEIPLHKDIVVHCSGGFRSAAASSFLSSVLDGDVKIFDLGESVKSMGR